MTAEAVYGMLILVFLLGFVIGDKGKQCGRCQRRQERRERLRQVSRDSVRKPW